MNKTHSKQELLGLYEQRLGSLDETLRSLTQIVESDQSIQVLSTTASLQKYRINRIMEVVSEVLKDEKEMVIVSILENYHALKEEKKAVDTQLTSLRQKIQGSQISGISQGQQCTIPEHKNAVPLAEFQRFKLLFEAEKQNNQHLTDRLRQSRLAEPISPNKYNHKRDGAVSLEQHEQLLLEFKNTQGKYSELQSIQEVTNRQIYSLKDENQTLMARIRQIERNQNQTQRLEKGKLEQLNSRLAQSTYKIEELQIQKYALLQQLEARKQQADGLVKRVRYETNMQKQSVRREKDEQLEERGELLRHKEETIGRLTRQLMTKNQQSRRLIEELSKARQHQQKLSYQIKSKAELIHRLENEAETKRRQNRHHTANQQQEQDERPDRRPYQRFSSPNHYSQVRKNKSPLQGIRPQSPNRSFGRVVQNINNRADIDMLNQQIYRLQSNLNQLKSCFKMTKVRVIADFEDGLVVLRRGLVHLKKTVENQIKLARDETTQFLASIAQKCTKLLMYQKQRNKEKMDNVKRLCEEQLVLLQQKHKLDHNQKLAKRVAQFEKELLAKDQRIARLHVQVEKYKDLSQNPYNSFGENRVPKLPVNSQIETIKIQAAPPAKQPVSYFKQDFESPSFTRQANIPSNPKQPLPVTLSTQPADKVPQSHRYQQLSAPPQRRVNQNQPRFEVSHNNYAGEEQFVRALQQQAIKITNQRSTKTAEIEAGFSELDEEIEAIIERRNKRNAKLLK